MEKIAIKPTHSTPKVIFDPERGVMELEGRSIMENPLEFYEPLMDWINEYIQNPKDTSIKIDLEYFNTPTNRILQTFFSTLSVIRNKGFSLVVYWLYDKNDEDIWESGQQFSNIAEMEFYYLERTHSTIEPMEINESETSPKINLDPDKGILEFVGKSIQEDARSFYMPVIEWLSKYLLEPKDTLVNIYLESFNLTTDRFLQLFFNMLSELKIKGCHLTVNWFYNKQDVNMLNAGKEYSFLSEIDFNYLEKHN